MRNKKYGKRQKEEIKKIEKVITKSLNRDITSIIIGYLPRYYFRFATSLRECCVDYLSDNFDSFYTQTNSKVGLSI